MLIGTAIMVRPRTCVRIAVVATRDVAVIPRLRFAGLGHAVGPPLDRQMIARWLLRRATLDVGVLRRPFVALSALVLRLDLELSAVVAPDDLVALLPGLA